MVRSLRDAGAVAQIEKDEAAVVAAAADPAHENDVLARVLLCAQRLREIGLSDLGLLAGGEGLDCEDSGGYFVFA